MRQKKIVLLIIYLFCLNVVTLGEVNREINFVDAAMMDVIELLAKEAGLNLVLSGDLNLIKNKRVTLRLKNLSAGKALDYVLATNNLSYKRINRDLLISAVPQQPAAGSLDQLIESIKLQYLSGERAINLLAKVLPQLKASLGGGSDTLVMQGNIYLIKEAKELIVSIDRPVPQVLIESEVVELSESEAMRLGLSYAKEPGTFHFIAKKSTKRVSPAGDLPITLNALISEGKAKVIAKPRIATLDNHEAVINIGKRIPYAVPVSSGSETTQWTIEYIDAGVKLRITPQVSAAGAITTLIQPEVSALSEWKATAAGEFPVISSRNASAVLRVKDGETIVIGGLLAESERETIARLPVVGYLPLIGYLFQNKTVEETTSEIIFMITPRII